MRKQTKNYLIGLFLLISLFPFLMKLGIQPKELQKNAVYEIYQKWKWQKAHSFRLAKEPLFFQADPEHPELSAIFLEALSKDFTIDPKEESRSVRVFFSVDSHIRVRLENNLSGKGTSWSSKQRIVNNGIVAAPWLATLMLILGFSMSTALIVSLLLLILWTSGWSLVGAFLYFFEEFSHLVQEMFLRLNLQDFQLWSVKSLCVYATLVIVLFCFWGARSESVRKKFSRPRWLFWPFLLEVFILYFAGVWHHWPSDIVVWKIYLASLAYRFFTYSFIFYFWGSHTRSGEKETETILRPSSVIFPLTLVLSGLSVWISSVLVDYSHQSLFRLKIFFIAFVMSFILGNRVLAMFLMAIIFAKTRVPEMGHWSSGLEWAFLFEGIFAGWVLSPFKFFEYQSCSLRMPRDLSLLVLMSFVLGIFLSSMGAPLYFSWILLFTANWAFLQINEPLRGRTA